MKRTCLYGVSVAVLAATVLAGPASGAHIAYNDCVYWAGSPAATPPHPTIQPNVTVYGIGTRPTGFGGGQYSPTSGLLKDFSTGQTFGVTATFTQNGGVNWQPGEAPAPGTGGLDCATGTDADKWFGPDTASLCGTIYYGSSSGWWVDLTFTGLNPNKLYTFVTTANRNGSTYVGSSARNTKYVISDIAGFVSNDSSVGTIKATTTIANDTTVFNTGYNTVNGYVARWSYINPGPDGDFTVRANWAGAAYGGDTTSPGKAYAFDAFCLIEEVPEPATLAIFGMGGLAILRRRWRTR